MEQEQVTETEDVKCIKSLGDGKYLGYGVLFDTKDLEGDTFTKNTFFGLERQPLGMSVYYDHTLGGVKSRIGSVIGFEIDDVGIKFEVELERNHRYRAIVEELLANKALGFSTGAMSHTVIRDGDEIKRWEIGELSFTPTPAEHKTIQTISEVKEVQEEEIEQKEESTHVSEETKETPVVSQVPTADYSEEIKGLNSKFDSLTTQMEQILTAMQQAKPAKHLEGNLYAEGSKNEGTKSLADFLLAVYRKDVKRLKTVYKALNGSEGSAGGYLVPEQYLTELLKVSNTSSSIEKYCRKVPMADDSIRIPILKQDGTYVSGSSQFFGGVTFTSVAENGSITSAASEPVFEQITLNAHKIVGLTELTNELREDSAFAVESVLMQMFGEALAWKKDNLILNGTGVNEPLGVYNSDALVSVDLTDATPTLLEIMSMRSRLFSMSRKSAVWVINPLISHLITSLENDVISFTTDMQGEPVMRLLGLPIEETDAMPLTIATGGLLLADFSKYLIAEKPSVRISMSEDAGFDNDTVKWRIVWRGDGQPWLRNPVNIGASSGQSLSAFVRSS